MSNEKRIGIGTANPLWTVTFYDDASGEIVGHLHVALNGRISFDGDVDASALLFAQTMSNLIESRFNRGVLLRLGNEPCALESIIFRTYLRLPLIIEAVQIAEVFEVNDKEHIHQGAPGDFLVKDPQGNLHVVKPEDFNKAHLRWYFYPKAYNRLVMNLEDPTQDDLIAEHPKLCESLIEAMRLLKEVSTKLKEGSNDREAIQGDCRCVGASIAKETS